MKRCSVIILCIILATIMVLLVSYQVLFTHSADTEKEYGVNPPDLFDENGIVNFESIEYCRKINSLNETFKAFEGNVVEGLWKYYS